MKRLAAAAAVLAASMMATTPVSAQGCWNNHAIDAAKVRNLDIMLMVTGLRCRMGPDNFQPDYYKFSSHHMAELNAANGLLRAQLHGAGTKAADRALDRMSVTIANSYGTGHPELSCKELRRVTRDLASSKMRGGLVEAANALVGDPVIPGKACATRVAVVRR